MTDITLDGFGRMRPPWKIPALLLVLLIGLMVLVSFPTPTHAADSDVESTLALLKRACEIEGGQFETFYNLNGDGSLESIATSCSGIGGSMCLVWEDGEWICVRSNPEQTVQQQVANVASGPWELGPDEEAVGAGVVKPQLGSGTRVETRASAPAARTPTPLSETRGDETR